MCPAISTQGRNRGEIRLSLVVQLGNIVSGKPADRDLGVVAKCDSMRFGPVFRMHRLDAGRGLAGNVDGIRA